MANCQSEGARGIYWAQLDEASTSFERSPRCVNKRRAASSRLTGFASDFLQWQARCALPMALGTVQAKDQSLQVVRGYVRTCR